ncbi:hypothetical protein KA043_02765, partial [Candidatus Saccharibacteria bacterium]|nr:hypothetical protein [Candidatus Saccharibacteria bacterium]
TKGMNSSQPKLLPVAYKYKPNIAKINVVDTITKFIVWFANKLAIFAFLNLLLWVSIISIK